MKIVTLIPSATEIVTFLGQKKSIIGRSHECDFPEDLSKIVKLTEPKINVEGTSGEIHKQIEVILEKSLSVYKVHVEELKRLNPDFIVTQSHCEVCAVSFSEVENIAKEHLGKNTEIISLQPNKIQEVFDDIRRVAKSLNVDDYHNNKLINKLEIRLDNIKKKTQKIIKPKILCVEWIDPLMAAGNWIPEMINIAGGEDIFGKIGVDSHWIKFEDIQNQDPDFIVFIPCGFNLDKTIDEVKKLLNKNNDWKKLKAFKNKNLYVTDGNQYFNRPGPRLIDSVEILAEIFHSNIFNFGYKNKGWINFFDKR
ncbi:cobalamin-binding protein [Candidatus Pelagibacter sp.]|nr:cobalamin-binding protein [Candidatus Pelagibacter sp.]